MKKRRSKKTGKTCFDTKRGRVCFDADGSRTTAEPKKKRGLSGPALGVGDCRPVSGRPGVIFCRTGKGLTGYEFRRKGR